MLSFIGIVYKNRHLIPYACRKNLYFSLIYSRLIYGINVFGKQWRWGAGGWGLEVRQLCAETKGNAGSQNEWRVKGTAPLEEGWTTIVTDGRPQIVLSELMGSGSHIAWSLNLMGDV